MTAVADHDYVELERQVLELKEETQRNREDIERLKHQRAEDVGVLQSLHQKVDRLDHELDRFGGRFDRKLDQILAEMRSRG